MHTVQFHLYKETNDQKGQNAVGSQDLSWVVRSMRCGIRRQQVNEGFLEH